MTPPPIEAILGEILTPQAFHRWLVHHCDNWENSRIVWLLDYLRDAMPDARIGLWGEVESPFGSFHVLVGDSVQHYPFPSWAMRFAGIRGEETWPALGQDRPYMVASTAARHLDAILSVPS